MPILQMSKLNEETHLFNANQKCWIVVLTGDERCLVKGRHRGRGRYIKGWVNKNNLKQVIDVEVTLEFYNKTITPLTGSYFLPINIYALYKTTKNIPNTFNKIL